MKFNDPSLQFLLFTSAPPQNRHSMRDRLRAVECPSGIIGAIGGCTTTGVGQRYGLEQLLGVKAKWMDKLIPL